MGAGSSSVHAQAKKYAHASDAELAAAAAELEEHDKAQLLAVLSDEDLLAAAEIEAEAQERLIAALRASEREHASTLSFLFYQEGQTPRGVEVEEDKSIDL